MSENQFVNADKKKLFTFLSYSWTLDNMIYGELAKEYGSLNKDDINNFREEIIAQLNTQEEDINFVKTYREIEKKINENHANDKLKEIYLEEIIEFCKTQKKPKRLEIIDELKLHLSKCEDGEILDFFKSIDGEIDKKSETNNKKILKEIWGRYETDSMIEISNPEIEKILQSDFMLNAVDAVRDEAIKSELKEIANQAQPFDSAPPITTADNNDFLGLGKFLSDVINLGRDAEKAISEFISKEIGERTQDDANLNLPDPSNQQTLQNLFQNAEPELLSVENLPLPNEVILDIIEKQTLLQQKFTNGTFIEADKPELLSVEKLNEHIKVLLDRGFEIPTIANSIENQKLIYAIVNKDLELARNALENGADFHIVNLESIILGNDDSSASKMIKNLNDLLIEYMQFNGEKDADTILISYDFWNKQYRGGNTALHLALLNDKKQTAQALLNTFYIDPQIFNNESQAVLGLGGENFKELLQAFSINKSFAEKKTREKENAIKKNIVYFENQKSSPDQELILAIRSNDHEKVKTALTKGADIYHNYINIDNMISQLNGNKSSPDPHSGLTIYDFAKALYAGNSNPKSTIIMEELSKKLNPDQDLISAISNNDLVAVQEAINKGANINCKVPLQYESQINTKGLFYYACLIADKKKDYKIVELLIEKGVHFFDKEDLDDDLTASRMIANLMEKKALKMA
jgi:hypothetical protein